jgi:peptidoglycan/LPS O-acetylase OafA/YrhL
MNLIREERLHYLDNIRALAMLLGVLLHAALAYSPMVSSVWLTADSVNSVFFDMVFVVIHTFRMPLFFLVSGYFALLLIEKRNVKGFLINRLKRILLPFIIFLPLALLVVFITIGWAIDSIDTVVPILDYMATKTSNQPNIQTLHLWFLLNLFFFCLLLAIFMFSMPELVAKFFSGVTVKQVLILLPILMIPALLTLSSVPHSPPSKLFPQLWSFGFFGLFFLLGCVIRYRAELLDEIAHYVSIIWIVGVTSCISFYYLLPEPMSTAETILQLKTGIPFTWQSLGLVLLEAISAVYLSLALLLLAKQYLFQPNRVMRYFMDAAYWIYIIHIPVLFWFQFLIIDSSMNIGLKFILSSGVVLLIGALSYHLLVRNTFIGKLLNGNRVKATNHNS